MSDQRNDDKHDDGEPYDNRVGGRATTLAARRLMELSRDLWKLGTLPKEEANARR